jgi:hypothetical protein
MTDVQLSTEQRLLYYHIICYEKASAIVAYLTVHAHENIAVDEAIYQIFEVMSLQCFAAISDFGAGVNNPDIVAVAKSRLTSSDLSDLGILAFNHVVSFSIPLLDLMRAIETVRPLLSNEQHVKDLLCDMLTSIESTIPGL